MSGRGTRGGGGGDRGGGGGRGRGGRAGGPGGRGRGGYEETGGPGGRGRGGYEGTGGPGGRGRGGYDGTGDPGGRGRGGGGRGPSAGGGGARGGGYEGMGPPGGRGRGGDGRGPSAHNVPSPSQIPATAPPASTAQRLSRDFDQKLTLQTESHPAVADSPASSHPHPASSKAAVASSPAALPPASSPAAPPPASSPLPPPASSPALPPASSKAVRFPTRPGYGKAGMKCVVRANHFLVDIADRDLNHYDVTITPEVISKKICRVIINKLVSDYQKAHLGNRMLAYDGGKSAYTAGELPFQSKDFIVKLADDNGRREREYKVSIKFAAKHSLYHLQQFLQRRQLDTPQETIQVLDVVLRTDPSDLHQVVGRSFFSSDFGTGELSDGLDYWFGFYQSLRPCQMGLSLNIDMSARAFYEPIFLTEYVKKLVRDLNRPLSDQDRVKIKRDLRGVRVEFKHLDYTRRYKISGLSSKPVNQLFFALDGGEETSVAQYFRQKYNIVLKYPMLPAIQSGSDAKPVYIPMEVCKIVRGQRYTRKLNERQVTQLLRAACKRPHEREDMIKGIIQRNAYNEKPLVKDEFGMRLRTELTQIDARVLTPPRIQYHQSGRESLVDPRVGQWNMINKKMVDAAKVEFWACVNFSRFNDPDGFCVELLNMCSSKGMVFSQYPLIPTRSSNPNKIEKTLIDIHKDCTAEIGSMNKTGSLQLLIIILPEVSGSYGKIKRICETELGIVSQCCQPKQASRFNKQYLENVALKINVKVGGRNCFLEQAVQRNIPYLTDRPTIIFGADVTHPSPGEDTSSSIAAVVASMDWPQVTTYRGLVSAQQHREEIIQGLYSTHQDPARGIVHGGMIRDLLIEFRRSTGRKPERIIFYRDGVSEGQFSQVLLEEMDAIRKACNSLEANYLPPVTFVVVQKRHHTRLFPANHGDRRMTDKSGNILPGTVIDTKICHPTEFDFYLCSHAGIQGTSRPAHYHVLYDENRFTADALQNLTNCLCYTYARCTKSVSIVPPAYYAHLAAFRARYYVEDEVSDGSSGLPGGKAAAATREKKAAAATRENIAVVKPLPVIKDNVKAVMFYC